MSFLGGDTYFTMNYSGVPKTCTDTSAPISKKNNISKQNSLKKKNNLNNSKFKSGFSDSTGDRVNSVHESYASKKNFNFDDDKSSDEERDSGLVKL